MSDELITAITSFVSAFLLFVVVKVTTVIKRKIKEVREETDMTVIIHEGDKIIVTSALGNTHTCVCTVKLQVMENGEPVWYLDEITPVPSSKESGDSDDTESDSLSS